MKYALVPALLLTFAAGLVPIAGAWVHQPEVAEPAGPRSADEISTKDLVRRAATLIADNYVFPDTGRQAAAMLSMNLGRGEYNGLDARQLAQALSRDLREYTEDRHFGAQWQPPRQASSQIEIIPQPPSGTFGFEKIERLDGNIGYLDLRSFQQARLVEETLHAAMRLLQGSDALIFDLRRNGGGDPETVRLLCSYLFDPTETVHLNSLYFRPADQTTEFWTTADLRSEAMPDTPVFVLTSGYTFSGAEEFTYNLQTRGRATVVGETTGGGAHPVNGYDLGDGIVLRIPVGRAINPITRTNWEGTGVSPDVACPADEALDAALELALEEIIETNPNAVTAAWALDVLLATKNPVKLSSAQLAEFAGEYGDRHIRHQDGRLEYRRTSANASWRPLIAIGSDAFMIEGVLDFRMEFERAGGDADGAIVGIRGVYMDRPSDYSERD
ncbi:MAG: S41 family peptidase [Phycisphaerales bacterium JB040]